MNYKYIAGFFDGERYVKVIKGNPRVTIEQVNKDVLVGIEKYTKVGLIYEFKKINRYGIYCQKDICQFLESILPYLIVKKMKRN